MKLVSQSLFHLIRMSRLLCLIALAIALDGDGIKFGLGDNGNLSVEVDAENFRLKTSYKSPFRLKIILFRGQNYFEQHQKCHFKNCPIIVIFDQNFYFPAGIHALEQDHTAPHQKNGI